MSNSTTEELLFGWTSTTWGFIASVVSCFFFGSHDLLLKVEPVQKLEPDPIVFQLFMNVSIFISSWLILLYNDFIFTWWGVMSACLWVTSSVFAVFAVKYLGLSVAQGVWSGCSILVSFLWGSAAFLQPIKSIPLCVLGMFFIAAGITGIIISESDLLDKFFDLGIPNPETEKILQSEKKSGSNLQSFQISWKSEPESSSKVWTGIACAIVFGITTGTMLIPLNFSPFEHQGIAYLISFGMGVIMVTPIYALVYFVLLVFFFERKPVFHIKILPLAGMGSGFLWNIGNWSSIYATLYLGFNVGFPLTQISILVSGFWSVVLFREIKGKKSIGLFCFSSSILIGGAILLGNYGGVFP